MYITLYHFLSNTLCLPTANTTMQYLQGEYTIATTNYVQPFSSAIQKDNFFATQFHPEKSGQIGERILEQFIKL
jgi:imidazoleglycerol phosphate synthase glutamine amidotransferase subunit HisH